MARLAEEVSQAEGLPKPLTWQTVQQWEKEGGTAPKRKRLAAVAQALGVDAAMLAGIDGSSVHELAPKAETSHEHRYVSDSQWALLQDFEILPEDDKASLRDTLHAKAANVRRVVADYMARQGVRSGTAQDRRVEAAYGVAPPAPSGSTRQYKKVTDEGPLLPADQSKEEKKGKVE